MKQWLMSGQSSFIFPDSDPPTQKWSFRGWVEFVSSLSAELCLCCSLKTVRPMSSDRKVTFWLTPQFQWVTVGKVTFWLINKADELDTEFRFVRHEPGIFPWLLWIFPEICFSQEIVNLWNPLKSPTLCPRLQPMQSSRNALSSIRTNVEHDSNVTREVNLHHWPDLEAMQKYSCLSAQGISTLIDTKSQSIQESSNTSDPTSKTHWFKLCSNFELYCQLQLI
jgi:hypothetical protein